MTGSVRKAGRSVAGLSGLIFSQMSMFMALLLNSLSHALQSFVSSSLTFLVDEEDILDRGLRLVGRRWRSLMVDPGFGFRLRACAGLRKL